ncbi:hypothetical protein TNCV_1756571 [Trichonephila clavipes]|nr:hypothetical protein TNCV_1756571 [Trichonephila clavipes]
MGVNSHLLIHNRFYGFTSWSRTRTIPIDCPWIFMINQLGSDQCTWTWGHCLLSELREWRQQTGRHNGLKEFGATWTIGEAYLKIIMSSFLGFCEWNTRNRWRDGQVCPDVDKELWSLEPDGSGVFWRWTSVSRCGQGTMAPWARRLGEKRKRRGDLKGEVEEKVTRESGRENGRRERGDGKRLKESRGERESESHLDWRKKERTRKRREKSWEKRRAGRFEEAERRIPEFFAR